MVKNFCDDWLETSYGIFPKKIFDYAEKPVINCHSRVNLATQFAGIEALRGKQDHVKNMINEFLKRRDFLVDHLNSIPNIDCVNLKLFMFSKIKKTISLQRN